MKQHNNSHRWQYRSHLSFFFSQAISQCQDGTRYYKLRTVMNCSWSQLCHQQIWVTTYQFFLTSWILPLLNRPCSAQKHSKSISCLQMSSKNPLLDVILSSCLLERVSTLPSPFPSGILELGVEIQLTCSLWVNRHQSTRMLMITRDMFDKLWSYRAIETNLVT